MLKRSIFGAALVALPVAILACSSSGVLPAPKSDKQSDDPDEPASPGVIGAIGASSGKDGGPASSKCSVDRDCRTGLRCFFPVSEGCAAQGQCLDFQDSPGCSVIRRCTCAGTRLVSCAPLGYAAMPVTTACLDAAAE
jgi:hypothetical protein